MHSSRALVALLATVTLVAGSMALPTVSAQRVGTTELGLLPPEPATPIAPASPPTQMSSFSPGPSSGASAFAADASASEVVEPGYTLIDTIDCGAGISWGFSFDLSASGASFVLVGDDPYDHAGPGADAIVAGTSFYSVANCEFVSVQAGYGDIGVQALDPNSAIGQPVPGSAAGLQLIANHYLPDGTKVEDWRDDLVYIAPLVQPIDIYAFGWGGHDLIFVDRQAGSTYFDGGQGNDTGFGLGGSEYFVGGIGTDFFNLGAGDDTGIGGPGNDRILGGPGGDNLWGDEGNDWVVGGNDTDIIAGGPGNDKLGGNGAYDEIYGETGNDRIWGGSHGDLISGGPGNDEINGLLGPDEIYGDGGDDILRGDPGNDTLVGGPGWDKLYGGDGWDDLYGGDGNDLLAGGARNDNLYGEAGIDDCRGNLGTDNAVACEVTSGVP